MSVLTDKSLRGALRYGFERLRGPVEAYTLTAELLLLHAIGRERTWLYAHPEEQLTAEQAETYTAFLDRRVLGEPTQHITGKQEFWGMEFEVTPDVLIPRPETEHLLEVALDRLAVRDVRAGRRTNLQGAGLAFADVGTGSGCIAIALAKEFPAAQVHATDISKSALDVAKRNAARLLPHAQIRFAESNLLDVFLPRAANPAGRPFDLIISNPPYIARREQDTLAIEVVDHEPEIALFGGEEGYELYAPLILQAQQLLKPGGLLVLELGHDSLLAVQPLLDPSHWTNAAVTNDLAGIPRVLSAELL